MIRVQYVEKGREHDFKRIDKEREIVARSYFTSGNLYYFRLDEFNYAVIAKEDIRNAKEWWIDE